MRNAASVLGFAEDVLEHFTQAESIFFLSEVCRTFMPGGVMRLSFPGLEGVLDRHYSPPSSSVISAGEIEAYSLWDHYHFYSKAELELVAKHLGFSRVHFVDYGVSEYADLSGLDTRSEHIGLNTYVELTK
jgi:predicted SAM-dependent methyltransferase